MKVQISRTMSTQHPDNVKPPFFADSAVMHGEDEIKEAFYVFSHLKSREQLWDSEGKEVDNYVVKKLLSNYEQYFRGHRLGKDCFLTVRVPNPDVERNEAKILIEALEAIPRNYDTASLFYGSPSPPIFEIAVPMTTNSRSLVRISQYYKRFVVGKKDRSILDKDIKIKSWVGDFHPESIRVIPLFEDRSSIINAAEISKEYMDKEKIRDYQRIWLARSDPALNYGSLSAVLMIKTSLMKLRNLQESSSVDIYPIIGCGSAPFRGNFKPDTVKKIMKGYPSIHTFTVQSAFKYDHPEDEVRESIEHLNETGTGDPFQVDVKRADDIIKRISAQYEKEIALLAPFINNMSKFIPSRRKRKLHIGLFGYSRSAKGISLPRAIKFCAALYSAGLPPELLGLSKLTRKDIDYVHSIYPSFEYDLKDSLKYLNKDNLKYFPQAIRRSFLQASKLIDYAADPRHQKVTSIIMRNFSKQQYAVLEEDILRAGNIRQFLG